MADQELCPLCGRVLGEINIDRHHLVPRTFKGKEQYAIHRICHRKIHATFTERELLNTYHSWDALRSHEAIKAFIEWVAKKDPGYYSKTATSRAKRGK
jgi:5-methylcytosine-specific restriction endonuclease McrA